MLLAVIAIVGQKSYELCCETVLAVKEKREWSQFGDLEKKKSFLSENEIENRRVKRKKFVKKVRLSVD